MYMTYGYNLGSWYQQTSSNKIAISVGFQILGKLNFTEGYMAIEARQFLTHCLNYNI